MEGELVLFTTSVCRVRDFVCLFVCLLVVVVVVVVLSFTSYAHALQWVFGNFSRLPFHPSFDTLSELEE